MTKKIYRRRFWIELSPAHVRVLDLLLEQPAPEYREDGHGRQAEINVAWMRLHTHWPEATIRTLLRESRQHFGVHTTRQLTILWKERKRP